MFFRLCHSYAVSELQRDIDALYAQLSPEQRAATPETKLGIFVVHNKLKNKLGDLPEDIVSIPSVSPSEPVGQAI